jgi:hypothetical protein
VVAGCVCMMLEYSITIYWPWTAPCKRACLKSITESIFSCWACSTLTLYGRCIKDRVVNELMIHTANWVSQIKLLLISFVSSLSLYQGLLDPHQPCLVTQVLRWLELYHMEHHQCHFLVWDLPTWATLELWVSMEAQHSVYLGL